MTQDRIDRMRTRLQAAFDPEVLEIADESHLHAGHPGAATGMGHFRVRIVSARFVAKNMLERHRMVYEALGPMMTTDIHALSLTAETPTTSARADGSAT